MGLTPAPHRPAESLVWVGCHSFHEQDLSAQASEASELAQGLGCRTDRSALPLAGSGPAAMWEVGPSAPLYRLPLSESAGWGQPALSTTASSHTHMGYRGSCQPERPPFPSGRPLHSSCPRGWGSGLALLITGPGPQSEMLSFQQGGDLEVPDRALFLGLDSEEVPLGLREHGVNWGQERRPGECASQEGLGEAEARGRPTRGRPGSKGLGPHQPSPLRISPGRM